MKLKRVYSLIVMAVAAGSAAAQSAATKPAADLSSPRGTLVSVYTAMQAGDVQGVMNCLEFAEAEEREVFEVNASQVAAPLRLQHAMEAKFGDAGKKPFDGSVEKSIGEMLERAKHVDINVNGDTAVVGQKAEKNPNAETELSGVTLKKNAKGEWRIVASTFPDNGGEVTPKQLALMKSMRDAVVSACDQTILRVERGEFKTADEAFAGYQGLLQPTAREAVKNGTATTRGQ
jgi:ketosteroid isomerase-like protein